MIFNATLISYTAPAVPDGNGGKTPGAVTAYPAGTRCCADYRRCLQATTGTAGVATDVRNPMFVPMTAMPRPGENGKVTFRIDRTNFDYTLTVASCMDRVHGSQSHYELDLKAE